MNTITKGTPPIERWMGLKVKCGRCGLTGILTAEDRGKVDVTHYKSKSGTAPSMVSIECPTCKGNACGWLKRPE